LKDDTIPLSIDDIKEGLSSIITTLSKEIAQHIIKENNLNGRSLAFKCHNLANASAYIEILQNNEK
jgi:hypothetical protein